MFGGTSNGNDYSCLFVGLVDPGLCMRLCTRPLESSMDTLGVSANSLPRWSFLVPLAGVAVIVLVSVRHTNGTGLSCRRRLPRPSAGLVGLLFLCVWCLLSLVYSTVWELAGASAVLACCGLVSWRRRWVTARSVQKEQPAGKTPRATGRGHLLVVVRDAAILLAAAILACFSLELPWNPGVVTTLPTFWWIELGLVGIFLAALFCFGRGRGTGPAIGVAVCMVIGFIQYYVALFRGTAIMPSDVYSVGTAVAVGGAYSYVLQGQALASIVCAVAAMTLLGYLRPTSSTHAKTRRRTALVYLGCGVALCLCFGWAIAGVSYADQGVEVEYFFTLDKYREQGILPSFIATWQDMGIKVPEGYTEAGARQVEADYAMQAFEAGHGTSDASDESDSGASDATAGAAGGSSSAASPSTYAQRQQQFEQVQPTVIAVMNETFSDLSIYDGIADAGYEGPQFYNNGISDALERGTLYVSAYGGGTCNTEFEFLTGISMTSVGAGSYPYTQYDLSRVDSLVRQFKVLGYHASAIHPNNPVNWNRDLVYHGMGFDDFYSIDDFEGAPTFHSGVTDRATYDKILDLLAQDDGPQLIFDVTMQNHSGYDQGNIPADQLTGYEPAGVSEATNARLNEYLSCIEASDRDLEYLMTRLEEMDRPVVLVFFGDHQPNVTTPYNDAYYPGEDEVTHAERAYQTTYFVWANYDVVASPQQSDRVDTSVNYLGGLLMDSVGGPMSEYQEAQLTLRQSIPAINLYGYEGADGQWYALADSQSPYAGAYDDGMWIGYLNFGERVK